MAYIIGIAGGSASGKTTFIEKLQQTFTPGQLTVLSQDHYYKPLHLQQTDANGEVNFDLPESLDMAKFLYDIELLESGKPLILKEYTFNNPGKEPQSITIVPSQVIVVEGLFIFEDPLISQKLNLKLFIDATEEIKFNRRLNRDSNERGLSHEIIHYQWNNHVKPSYEKFLLPHKETVDMVIVNNTHFDNSLRVVVDHILRIIS